MSPDKPPISRITAANVFAEMLAWQDRCEAAEGENASLKARITELEAELAKAKEPPPA